MKYVLALVLMTSPVYALEADVMASCAGDHLKFCVNTVPGSKNNENCFKRNGPNLNSMCLNALKNSNQYAKDYQDEYNKYYGITPETVQTLGPN